MTVTDGPDQTLRIDRRFNGPPDSAHGGVACGVFAGAVDSRAATVRLLAPPPMDTDFTISREGEVVTVTGPAGPVAEVRSAPPAEIEPLPWLSDGEVDRSRSTWDEILRAAGHPFPTCFGCGGERPDGDGLELFAGLLPGTDISGAWWEPDESIATAGLVDDWAVWAAADCPSGGVVIPLLDDGQLMMLGQLQVWIHQSPEVGCRYQVVARSQGRKGRRLTSDVAVVAESGVQLVL